MSSNQMLSFESILSTVAGEVSLLEREVDADEGLEGFGISTEDTGVALIVPDEEIMNIAAEMLAAGYGNQAICTACEFKPEEWKSILDNKRNNGFEQLVGEYKRSNVQQEVSVDGKLDQLEDRAIKVLSAELSMADDLTVGEKLAIAKFANAAKRKRERDADLAAKIRGNSNPEINVQVNNVTTLMMPPGLVESLSRVGKLSQEELMQREFNIAKSLNQSGEVNMKQASSILGVDLTSNNTVRTSGDVIDAVIEETDTNVNHGSLVSGEPG